MTPKVTQKQQELQKANLKKKHNEATATPKVTKITETAIHQNLRRFQKRCESNKSCKKQTEREKHNEDYIRNDTKATTTPKTVKIAETVIYQNPQRLQKRCESNKNYKKQTERKNIMKVSTRNDTKATATPKSTMTPKATRKQQ
ncbi:24292_t:CDS:2 [Dentiscutata erythropus]|uniref:24292_t:CDS:1 n=1 Tax=Dentiscutata erythropus TaxID=1348616 RepID=A0A9N8YR61_9GLOM|nr:24292_t:CDS:2 [Dentiscutata erythropus]